jgi:RNA polymerase sigma factor (sigma-70 family)
MLLQLNGVGKQKIKYKDHNSIEFDTLPTYLLLAKKAISKFANTFYSGLSKKMLKDEDAVASVANAIMMADWRWDDNYKNEKGTKKNKYSYRNQCALWAIQTHITKNYKHSKKMPKNIISLDYEKDNSELSVHQRITDNSVQSPIEKLIKEEEDSLMKKNLNDLMDNVGLSDRQKDYIRLYYYESYTFEKIGKKYGITREAVRQGLNKAIDIVRGVIK